MIKLVKEHLNEKFEEESDPINDMGIGGPPAFEKALYDFIFESTKGYWSTLSSIKILLPDRIFISISHPPNKDNFMYSKDYALKNSDFNNFIEFHKPLYKGYFGDAYTYYVNEKYYFILRLIDKIEVKKILLPGHEFKGKQMYTHEINIIWKNKDLNNFNITKYINKINT